MNRKPNNNIVLIIVIGIIGGIIFFSLVILNSEKETQKRLLMLGDLKFSGRVINSKIYDYGGRPYRLVCLKLDYSNKNNFYIFNYLCAIKIKDGIATMSVGGANSNSPVIYVEVATKENTMTYRYKNTETNIGEIDLRQNGLTEAQMNFCN
jgi:hypothetical protein